MILELFRRFFGKRSGSTGSRVIVYDTETTGLHPDVDELLSLSILDGDGNVLFSEYFRPSRVTTWPGAERINGISPEMVKDKRPAVEYRKEIQDIFDTADVLVTYNGRFDGGFLKAIGVRIPVARKCDVMLAFARHIGEWDSRRGSYRWHKLTKCAEHFGYIYKAHDALEDARATLWCYRKMVEGRLL